MRNFEIETQLKRLRLRLPVDVVRDAVQRLKNGNSLYSLYAGSNALVAKDTAKKIRHLWDEGELSFLLDVSCETEIAEEASKNAVLAGGPFLPFQLRRDPTAVSRRLREILPELPQLDWTIEVLEKAGIDAEEALAIMNEVGDFQEIISREKWSKPQLIRFAELHYLVHFANANVMRTNQGPPELIRFVARSYATGLVDANWFMQQLARDVMRYQVWRGPKFLQAFQRAQIPTSRVARRRLQIAIQDLIRLLVELQLGNETKSPKEESDG